MKKIIVYHNPRCAKSRETLELVRKKAGEPEIVEYLKTPPSLDTLASLLSMLGIKAEELVRKKEDIYKKKFHGIKFTEKQWLKILHENPVLIERPIVVKDKKAIIGRPPEKVAEIL